MHNLGSNKTLLWRLIRWFRIVGTTVAILHSVFYYFIIYLPVRSNVSDALERAEKGSTRDQYVLGVQYLTGLAESRTFGIIPKDNPQAVYWLGRAAQSGHSPSYAYYARALEREGQRAAALEWRAKAARAETSK